MADPTSPNKPTQLPSSEASTNFDQRRQRHLQEARTVAYQQTLRLQKSLKNLTIITALIAISVTILLGFVALRPWDQPNSSTNALASPAPTLHPSDDHQNAPSVDNAALPAVPAEISRTLPISVQFDAPGLTVVFRLVSGPSSPNSAIAQTDAQGWAQANFFITSESPEPIVIEAFSHNQPVRVVVQNLILPEDNNKNGLADYRQELDIDHDGLLDGQEVDVHHTNPNVLDTDQDGLGDGAEVNAYHSNPTLTDTDSDGLSDNTEVTQYFSKPDNADSDADSLTDAEEILYLQTSPIQNNQIPLTNTKVTLLKEDKSSHLVLLENVEGLVNYVYTSTVVEEFEGKTYAHVWVVAWIKKPENTEQLTNTIVLLANTELYGEAGVQQSNGVTISKLNARILPTTSDVSIKVFFDAYVLTVRLQPPNQ